MSLRSVNEIIIKDIISNDLELRKCASKVYKIRSGDTLYDISGKDIQYQKIIEKANPDVNWSKLQIDQEIVIPPKPVKQNANMRSSYSLFDFIKKWESVPGTNEPHLKPYDDGFGNITVGWGRVIGKGDPTHLPEISYWLAEAMLEDDILEAEQFVIRNVDTKLTQGQFDATVSLVFNAGGSAVYKSDFFKKLNSGDIESAGKLLKSTLIGNAKAGLSRRRSGEYQLFVS